MVEHLVGKEMSFCLHDPAVTLINGKLSAQPIFLS